jgi:hypothetical protein
LDQMIKCIPESDLIKAFNFHHFCIQRINIKLIFAEALNCKCYIFNLFRQLFNTIIFIHSISLSMLPLLCTRERCLFSLRIFFIFPFISNWNWLLFSVLFKVDIMAMISDSLNKQGLKIYYLRP